MPDQSPVVYETDCVGCGRPFRFTAEDAEFAGPVMKSRLALPAPMVVRCPHCGAPNRVDFSGGVQ